MYTCVVQTYQVHTESVWALAAGDESLSVVYSGGRDRAVFRTKLAERTSELLVVEQASVYCVLHCRTLLYSAVLSCVPTLCRRS